MLLERPPRPSLRPWIKRIWASEPSSVMTAPQAERERVLPTGMMHLVFRLSEVPLRLFEEVNDQNSEEIGCAIVGGARSKAYIRDISVPSASVGAQLYPGAAEVLFGVPASELSERHTRLEELWGRSANEAEERILAAKSPEQQLAIFESILTARLPNVHCLHPVVSFALDQFTNTSDVSEVVRETGYSHRQFIAMFTRAVGLTPKLYCRIRRFQKVLELAAAKPSRKLLDLALDAEYSDQPHFNRQFREFAGVSPTEYQKLSPSSPNHLPVRDLHRKA